MRLLIALDPSICGGYSPQMDPPDMPLYVAADVQSGGASRPRALIQDPDVFSLKETEKDNQRLGIGATLT